MLRTIEQHFQIRNSTFIGGEKIGIADIALGSMIYWLQVLEDVLEVKVFDASRFPKMYKSLDNFKRYHIIKNNLPDQHEMFIFFKKVREMLMEASND